MNERSTRYYSGRQESRNAKNLGKSKVSNSGATLFNKGDLTDEYSLLDCKTMIKPQESVRLLKDWFKKIKEECFAMGKRFYGIIFDFGDGRDYIAIPVEDYKEFFQAWVDRENEK